MREVKRGFSWVPMPAIERLEAADEERSRSEPIQKRTNLNTDEAEQEREDAREERATEARHIEKKRT